jgi:hypothetical protein
VRSAPGKGEQRLRRVAAEVRLGVEQVRLAVGFYAAYPEEIDLRIAADEEAARRAREVIDRRERLLSS